MEYIAFGEVLYEEHSSSFVSPYLYNAKELDRDTNLYYYGARYYDPKVSVFLNVDPLAEQTMEPYAYVGNNPVMFVDPTGMRSEKSDGIIIGKSIKNNFILNQALKTFVSTEEGKAFLSNYAQEGDVVSGVIFNKNGKYHKKGIDIRFEGEYKHQDTRGTTSGQINGSRGEILFTINSNPKVESQDGNTYDTTDINVNNIDIAVKAVLSRTFTIFHEAFLHGDHYTKDYLDDKIFNKSNIDPHILQHYENSLNHAGHGQAQFGSDASGLLFNTQGLKGLQSANSKWSLGKHYNKKQLERMMWNFTGSYKKFK